MADNPCLDLVRESIDDMSAAELDEVIKLLKAEQSKWVKNGLTTTEAAKKAGEEVSNALKAAVKIERRNAAINRRIRLEAVDYVGTQWSDDPVEGILALLYGSPKARPGSRNSAAAAQSANFRRYVGGLQSELEAAGLFDLVRRGEMDRDISKALWYIEDERVLESIPASAVDAARILNKWREIARLEANRSGAWIPKAINYVVRQTHSADRILRAGFDNWVEAILPKLDLDRMFPEGIPNDLNTWLREAFANLTTGVRPRSPTDATAERMGAFKGPRNLAKRLSADRTFYFKSPDDWYDYNQDYGSGSLREAYINDLHRRAEATGLIQVLGTNPEYNLDSIVKAVRTMLSRTDPERLRAFDAKSKGGEKFENAMRELNGYTRTIASSSLAHVGAFTRMWAVLTSLGGATLSAITDVPIRASALRYQGNSFLGQIAKGVISPFKRIIAGTGSEERRAIVHAAGYFNDVALRNMVGRFSPDENITGKIHQATNTFFKWNLLGPWTDEMRRSSIESMANFLGEQAELNWGQLSERTRRALERFSIQEKEWELIRRGLDADDDGVKFLTPTKVRELPLLDFTDMAAPRIEAVKRGLLERIQKRMKADAREQKWIDSKHEAFTTQLEGANERLLELANSQADRVISRRELLLGRAERETQTTLSDAERGRQQAFDKMVERVSEANARIGKLGEELERIRDWAKSFFETDTDAPSVRRAARRLGFQEATLRAKQAQAQREINRAISEFKTAMTEAERSVSGLGDELTAQAEAKAEAAEREVSKRIKERYDAFNEGWQHRFKQLQEYITELQSRMAARREDTAGDLDKLGGQIERILDNTRATVADRLQRFYADEVDSAVITPDSRTLAFVRRGTQAGTAMGEALRLFWQFKTFSIGIMQRGFMREFYGYDLGRGGRFGMSEIRGLALLLASTTAFGYASMTLKELLRGREPRDPTRPRTWADAMAQGGSLGIYGDYLLGTQARFGGGFLSILGGPAVGRADDITQIMGTVADGNDPRAQMLKFVMNNVPYNNLFYTKVVTDYLFFYELMEAMNPGYLRRFERKITEETGSEWWLRPSEAAR
jgi:hypothetical protein